MADEPQQPPAEGAAPEAGAGGAPAPAAKSGLMAWLPLIVTLTLMPALAFVMTKFVILPKLQHDLQAAAGNNEVSEHSSSNGSETKGESKGEAKGEAKGEKGTGGKEASGGKTTGKSMVPLGKVLVNIAGSMGSRYLMTEITVAGTRPDFATFIDKNKPQLLDTAAGILSAKTIMDLEKPSVRNVIRSELIGGFNNALGGRDITDLYLTEFAVQ